MGGAVALKGSDDPALVDEARRRGAVPVSPGRAIEALRLLAGVAPELDLLASPGEMGEDEARAAGLEPIVVGSIGEPTSAADTRRVAAELARRGVDLLLFVGGDGTAVDVLEAIGDRVPALGIPAGVKMHSAVFAMNARSAGELALLIVQRRVRQFAEAEVMDVDEEALRAGVISPRLHGYLRAPLAPAHVQSAKTRSIASDRAAQEGIAHYLVDELIDDHLCFIGPGTTTRSILGALGLEKTVLGVDAVRGSRLVAKDADEATLLYLLGTGSAKVVVTPVGGQGFLFGRGNQQLSARVLERVGRKSVIVVATEAKIVSLGGRPLLVDTGDPVVDQMLSGYIRVVTGYGREIVYRVAG
jgi:predicted polyphosphate/ATP-dependent NAD kinase